MNLPLDRAFLIAVLLLLNNSLLLAKDCNTLAVDFDTAHRQVLQQQQPGSDGYFSEIHTIEDAVFEAIQQCPDSAVIFAAMGELQLSLGQPSLAQLYGEKAVRLNSDIWQGHYVLGSSLNMREQYTQGLKHLQIASDLQPENYSLLVNLCSSFEKNKNYTQAITVCSRAIEKGPYEIRGTAYYLRSLAHSGNGKQILAETDRRLATEFGYR